jgi:hypothetical protein
MENHGGVPISHNRPKKFMWLSVLHVAYEPEDKRSCLCTQEMKTHNIPVFYEIRVIVMLTGAKRTLACTIIEQKFISMRLQVSFIVILSIHFFYTKVIFHDVAYLNLLR